jgi:hypothetical protein
MYIFVPRTRIPKFKKISSRKMLDTYRYHLTRGGTWSMHMLWNNNIRMKPMSYGIHGNVLRMFDVCASRIARKFQEHVNHNMGY